MNDCFPWSKAMNGLIVEKDLGDIWPSGPQNQMPAIPMWMPGVDSGSGGAQTGGYKPHLKHVFKNSLKHLLD